MKKVIKFCFATIIIFMASCKKDTIETPPLTHEQQVEASLNNFVANLATTQPTSADVSNRVRQYMLSNPSFFFGSTVTLLDTSRIAFESPYWYRSGDSLRSTSLMDTAYHINDQLWLRQAISSRSAIWTDPYFDAGGGNIWMKTRSVPVILSGRIIAVATTDLAL